MPTLPNAHFLMRPIKTDKQTGLHLTLGDLSAFTVKLVECSKTDEACIQVIQDEITLHSFYDNPLTLNHTPVMSVHPVEKHPEHLDFLIAFGKYNVLIKWRTHSVLFALYSGGGLLSDDEPVDLFVYHLNADK